MVKKKKVAEMLPEEFVSGFDVKVAATIITARPSFSHRFDIISTLSMQMDKVKQFSCS